jgi:hypothetical protein
VGYLAELGELGARQTPSSGLRGAGEFAATPAVLCEPSEIDELATFLQVGMMSGWDVALYGTQDMLRVRLSHDEWVEFRSESTGILDQLRAELRAGDVEILA